MITRYTIEELLNSNLFVKEPVFELLERIKKNPSKKIILTGGRGIGKSVVLQTQEHQNRNTQEQSIYMSFSGIGVFAKNYPSDFVEHYYELVMSYNLLSYLKRNYEISYEKEFKEFENYLEIIAENTNSYIKDSGYKKIELKKHLKFGEISTRILETWRTNFNIKKLTLLIDRFDWTNNKDELSQKILQRYFYLFNKIVITTDSENINYESLEKKGYSLLEVDYGKKIEVVKKIIETYVLEQNLQNEYDIFPIQQITNNMYEKLIQETSGNISSMLNILEKTYLLSKWDKNVSLKKIMTQASEEQLERQKTYQKTSKPFKLYL